MKVKNIAFSGFMASILMAGAAYAEGVPTLATDQYVIQGVNYAISQAQDYTDDKDATMQQAVLLLGDKISTETGNREKLAGRVDVNETAIGTLTGTVGDSTTGLVKAVADNTAAIETKQDALPATTGNVGKVLKVGESGLVWANDTSYDDSTLVNHVTALETTVGDEDSGLVADVATNTQSIANLGTNKANVTDVYTKTEVNGFLDGKQANLTTEQLAATNSGITADKVSGYDSHVGNTDIHVTADQKTEWSGKQNAITASAKVNADYVDDSASTNKFVTATEKSTWNAKQDAISDLNTIRTGAAAGATALQNSCESGYCLVTPTGGMVSIATISENTNWVITPPVTE